VAIDMVPMPDPRRDAREGLHPEMLGLYEGVPIAAGSEAASFTLPGRIRIFKRNIERMARDREQLVRELRTTLLHEIGHHLGWDEDELSARGLA
jgi:predicted Zn-dependent protease with MMP-like domain